jgi:cation:H+ antiporter
MLFLSPFFLQLTYVLSPRLFMSLLFPLLALILGLILLVWSADRFVDGAVATARHAGMPTLLIGIVIIGFGTSAPEMVVSAISSFQGNPGLALGNAYGSNISNIGLILGLTAMLSPIAIKPGIVRSELPVLILMTLITAGLLSDLYLSRFDAIVLLVLFALVMGWWIISGLRNRNSGEKDLSDEGVLPLKSALIWLFVGLVLLVVSSRMLVWGAVVIARTFGVSDLIIGLTVVAVGTSLPELASAVAATRKGEHDLALGNVLGSNLFNTLAVVGIAGVIHPLQVVPEVLYRDCLVMGLLVLVLVPISLGLLGQRRISRLEGLLLLICYLAYNGYLFFEVFSSSQANL